MTRIAPILLIAAAVPILSVAVYVAAVLLGPADAAVLSEAGEHLERARRLLGTYEAEQQRLQLVLSQLQEAGVATATDPAEIEKSLESDRSPIDQGDEALKALGRSPIVQTRRALEERYQSAGGAGEPGPLAPQNLSGSLSQVSRTLSDGIKTRNAALRRNAALLDEALKAVEQALATSRGEMTGAAHPQANRLKGIILKAQAVAARDEARRLRAEAEPLRRRFTALVAQHRALTVAQHRLDESKVRDRIEVLRDEADATARYIASLEGDLAGLDTVIHDLEGQIAELRQRAQTARTALEALEDRGVNLLEEDGFQKFAAQYESLAEQYRLTTSEAYRLEFGTLRDARLDQPGDYLQGQFIPDQPGGKIEWQRGLFNYRQDRQTVATDLENHREMLDEIRTNIAAFEQVRDLGEQYSAKAETERTAVRDQAADTVKLLLDHVRQADAAGQDAAQKARSAVNAFKAAERVVADQSREAGERIATAGPTSRERSPFKLRSEDRWIAGQVANEKAQAQFLLASILGDIYAATTEDAALAAAARSEFEIAEADPDQLAAQRNSARQEAIETARQAIQELEKSSRDLNNNWTVAAQTGAMHDLLALLESPAHLETALANYEAAIQGREQSSLARPFVERAQRLRSR